MTSQISKPLGPFSLDEICRKIGAELSNSKARSNLIKGIASLQSATKEQISFLENRKYYKYFCNTQANAVIVHRSLQIRAPKGLTLLFADNPHKAFALVSRMFHPLEEALKSGVHKTHIIDGRIRPALLLEIFTAEGIGTQIVEKTRDLNPAL